MSFDSSLRTALLSAHPPNPVDTELGLLQVGERIRSAERRRLSMKVAGVATLALAVLWWPRGESIERHTYVPPARDKQIAPRPVLPDRGDPGPGTRFVSGSGRQVGANEAPRSRAGVATRPRSPARGLAGGSQPQARTVAQVPPESWARVVEERFEVNYVAGTHVGENGGGGCWAGPGATDSNDCMPYQVGPAERQVAIEAVSDDGSTVGFQVYEYHGQDSIDHGVFCGATGPITVHPEAMVQVSVDTSGRCSDHRPKTGQIVVRFR